MKKLNTISVALLLCIALAVVWASRDLSRTYSDQATIGKKVSDSLSGLSFSSPVSTPFDESQFEKEEYLRGYEDGWHQGLLTATRYKDQFFVAIYEPHHELSPYEQGEVDGWGSTFEFAERFRKQVAEEIRGEAMNELLRRVEASASSEALEKSKKMNHNQSAHTTPASAPR